MNFGKVSDWLQVGGLFGVLGGLLFVGLQLKQDRQIASTAVIAEAASRRMYWAELIGQNPDVWIKGLAGQPMSAAEAVHFDALATSWELSHYSYFYNSNHMGVSTDTRFVREWALELHTNPGLLAWWRAFRQRLSYTSPTDSEVSDWPEQVEEELAQMEIEASATD
jgi:hypothetical protein